MDLFRLITQIDSDTLVKLRVQEFAIWQTSSDYFMPSLNSCSACDSVQNNSQAFNKILHNFRAVWFISSDLLYSHTSSRVLTAAYMKRNWTKWLLKISGEPRNPKLNIKCIKPFPFVLKDLQQEHNFESDLWTWKPHSVSASSDGVI